MILLSLACTGSALAQGKADTARAHYKEGKAHYQLGEYRDALTEFKAAYHVVQDPAFLFNVAQCHRQLHENEEALRVYNAYLRDAPAATNRAEVEKFIRELTIAVEKEREREKSAAIAPAAPLENPASPPAVVVVPPPAPLPPPVPVATPVQPVASEAELEVVANLPQSTILINHNQVGKKEVKLHLPPGLYSVGVEAEGFQSAEGAIALLAGDRTSVSANLLPVKSHGWRSFGTVWLITGVLSEGVGIFGHVKANEEFQGSDDFNKASKAEKIGQGAAVGSAILAFTCYTIDWLANRGHVDPESRALLAPTRRGAP